MQDVQSSDYDDYDDFDDYEDDFQDESLGDDDLGLDDVDKAETVKTNAASSPAIGTSNNNIQTAGGNEKQASSDENDDYGEYDDDFEDLETSNASHTKNVNTSLSARVQTNDSAEKEHVVGNSDSVADALHQQALKNIQSKTIGNVVSFGSLIASESSNEQISTSSLKEEQRKLDKQINNMDKTNRASLDDDYDVVRKTNMLSPTRLRQDGGIPNLQHQQSSQSMNLDPVSMRTSVALLSMLGELSDHDVNKLKVSNEIDHKLVNTLDWLASAGVLTDGNVKYTDESCLSQATVQDTTSAAKKSKKRNNNSVTLPGGVDEAVMKLIVECVLENLDEPNPAVVERNSANSPSSLDFIPRKRNLPTEWSVDENDQRINDLMPMVEENYIEMVKRVTKINLKNITFPSDYEFSQYASHQRLLKIQKHMVEIMCDIFTDPSVIQTVKMGVTSRVLNEEDKELRKMYSRKT
jgi:hypothetical protein